MCSNKGVKWCGSLSLVGIAPTYTYAPWQLYTPTTDVLQYAFELHFNVDTNWTPVTPMCPDHLGSCM